MREIFVSTQQKALLHNGTGTAIGASETKRDAPSLRCRVNGSTTETPPSLNLLLATPRLALRDGQGRVNVEIVRRWLARGHRVTAVTRDVSPDLLASPGFTWIDLRDGFLPTMLLRRRLFAFRSRLYIEKYRKKFDLFVADGAVTLAPADVNCAHYVHGGFVRVRDQLAKHRASFRSVYHGMLTRLGMRLERIAFANAKQVVAVSSSVRDQLVDIGIEADRISIIWNGIDVNEFHPGSESREALGLPENVFLALFAGDIKTGRKNLDTVLRALRHLPDVHLVIAGNAKGSPYPKIARDLGVSDRTHFLGFRSDLSRIMRAVDVFVYPAVYEPLGLVVLEALASGLAVVTAKTTGAAALIGPDEGFVLGDACDDEALAAAVRHIMNDSERRARMAEAGRTLAVKYTWKRMTDEYVELFERIGRQKSAR